MSTPRQRAYLEAMGIPVWVARNAPGEDLVESGAPAAVQLGPGSGHLLMLCGSVSEPSGALATDVARVLGSAPVWGWPGEAGTGTSLAEAVSEGLFTHVLVFGEATEASVFGGPAPEAVGPAAVLRFASLQELESSPGARRELWRALTSRQLVSPAPPGSGEAADA